MDSTTPHTMGDWAEHYYRRLHLPVLPVAARTKHPMVPWKPFQAAWPTSDEIELWWHDAPEAGLAAVLRLSPFLVIDEDGDNAADLTRSAGWLDERCPVVRTGSGRGCHRWFRKPEGVRLRDRIALLTDGGGAQVDIRTEGVVILPPTIHPCGQPYTWARELVSVEDVPEAPASLVAACLRAEAPVGEPASEGPIPQGQREHTLLRILGAARRQGATEAGLRVLAEAENTRCVPPLESRDLERLVRSLLRYAPTPDDEPVIEHDAEPESTTTTTAPSIVFQTAYELCHAPEVHGRFVVAPYLYAEAISDFASPPKDGKSTLLRAMVKCLVTGTSFLGYPAPEPSPVVILSEERRHSFVEGLRAAGLATHTNVHIALAADLRAATWPQAVEAAVRLCTQEGATLLVADTVSGLARLPQDLEDKSSGALLSLAPLQVAAEAGIAVATSRHHRKSGGSVVDAGRGSNAFAGEVDVLTAVRLAHGLRHVRVLESIGRFTDLPESLRVELVRGPEGDTFRLLAGEDGLDPATLAVLDALPGPDRPAIDLKALALDTGLSESTCQRTLDPLIAAGVVAVLGNGRRGNPRRYYRVTNGLPS